MKAACLWLLLTLACEAAEPYVPTLADPLLEPWRFRHEEMLTGYGVLCMTEAVDGSLYFGGTEGLVRYDGFEAELIPYGDGLLQEIGTDQEAPWIDAVLAAEGGGVLAVVENSLVLWRAGQWRLVFFREGQSSSVSKLARAPDGAIWLLLPGELWRISSDLEEIVEVVSLAEPELISTFCFDEAGDVWFVKNGRGGATGLNHIPMEQGRPALESKWRTFAVPSERQSRLTSLTAGLDGLIWYVDRTLLSGLEALDSRSGQWVEQEEARLDRVSVYSLITAPDGTIWGGLDGAISRLDLAGKTTVYSQKQLGLPEVPYALYETSDRRLWVIGKIGYVYSIDLGTEEWLSYEGLNFQCETEQGVQWFLERSGGVVSHDPRSGEWLKHRREEGQIDSSTAIAASADGLIWTVGRYRGKAAISVYDGARWTRFLHGDFADWIEPKSVYEAKDGTLWFGAGGRFRDDQSNSGGALQYEVLEDGSVRLRKHHTRPLLAYYAFAFAETAEAFWVGGTMVQGYDPLVSERRFAFKEPRNKTVDMLVDGGEALWLVKEDLGIFQRQGEGWRRFTTREGLSSLNIADLLLLPDGSILAGSDEGIDHFDGNSWTSLSYLKHFTMSKRWSGMRATEGGVLWFNTVNRERLVEEGTQTPPRDYYGTTRHRPEAVPPDTRITEYVKKVSQPGNCRIEWLAQDPWGATSRENLQYSWRINGESWSEYSYATGRTFLDLPHGRYRLEVRARDGAFNVDPSPDRVEFVVVAPIWIQPWFVVMVVAFVGMIVALIWIIVRNRERHLRERQLEREQVLLEKQRVLVRQQEEREQHLLEMDQLKTGFFTNISHELRTPLTVILGPLRNLLAEETDGKRKRVLGMMERNANRISVLISQLLDFRKLEKSEIKTEVTEGDLVAFLGDVVASLEPLADSSRVSCRFLEAPPCWGCFDPDKLQKIATNLVSNAIKYTPAGGAVSVALQVEADDPSNRLACLVIEDTGSGIDEEHRGHVFERFYRVPKQRIIDGSGIGLNLTHELVGLWGGTIDVESPIHDDAERPGSRFTVRLPIDRAGLPEDAVVLERAKPSDPNGFAALESSLPKGKVGEAEVSDGAALILVVEDDDDIRAFIAEGLESEYRVEVASNGAEGLERTRSLIPDLVVTDLMMPLLDGMGMCRALKGDRETCHIPVIMLTAKASLDSQIDGLETGADDYVTKPFHMALLQARIRNLLESRRLLAERYRQQLTDSLQPEQARPERDPALLAAPESASALDREFLDKASAALNEHFSDPEFNADQLASALNMSRRTLQRKLNALTDRSPANLINEFRLGKAAVFLMSSSSTITEIAFDVGFSDSSNFSKRFRKVYGLSPSDYRNRETS